MKKMLRIFVTIMTLFSASIISIESAQAGLYAFTSHTFTACGATGRTGPTTANCTSTYSAAAWSANNSYFSTSSGIQLWTVPSTARYKISAYGASGGIGNLNIAGGKGAFAEAQFQFTQGNQIKILVGQAGIQNVSNGGAGGGGGSFVTTSANTALVVAGGGGGGGGTGAVGTTTGVDGASTSNGATGRDSAIASGSNGSGGGSMVSAWSGSSGGGLTGDGGNGYSSSSPITNGGGKSFTNGGTGGVAGASYGTVGGFGGGGGSSWAAGGGGGYSGGAGDSSDGAGNSREGAGGGGSFTSGTNATITSGGNIQTYGYITIQILVGAPDAPTIGTATMLSPTSASVTFSAPSNNNGDTITAYTAISTPESRTATITQSGSGTITVTGLSPDMSYVFRVYATNSYGNSSLSSASTSITTTRSPTSITLSLAGNAQVASYRTPVTVTATVVGTEGRVTFFINSKRLGNCLNKATTSLVATCSWKPSIHGSTNLSATFTPTSSAYLSSSTSRIYGVVARTNLR